MRTPGLFAGQFVVTVHATELSATVLYRRTPGRTTPMAHDCKRVVDSRGKLVAFGLLDDSVAAAMRR